MGNDRGRTEAGGVTVVVEEEVVVLVVVEEEEVVVGVAWGARTETDAEWRDTLLARPPFISATVAYVIVSRRSFFSMSVLQWRKMDSKQWPATRSSHNLTGQSGAPCGQLRSIRQDFASCLSSCMKAELTVLGSLFLISLMVSVHVKQH